MRKISKREKKKSETFSIIKGIRWPKPAIAIRTACIMMLSTAVVTAACYLFGMGIAKLFL